MLRLENVGIEVAFWFLDIAYTSCSLLNINIL